MSRTTLQFSDFKYIGYINLPAYAYSPNVGNDNGFAIRYVGGKLHILSLNGYTTAPQWQLYEFEVPPLNSYANITFTQNSSTVAGFTTTAGLSVGDFVVCAGPAGNPNSLGAYIASVAPTSITLKRANGSAAVWPYPSVAGTLAYPHAYAKVIFSQGSNVVTGFTTTAGLSAGDKVYCLANNVNLSLVAYIGTVSATSITLVTTPGGSTPANWAYPYGNLPGIVYNQWTQWGAALNSNSPVFYSAGGNPESGLWSPGAPSGIPTGGNGNNLWGLYYDPANPDGQGDRLYHGFGLLYGDSGNHDPSVAITTLDDPTTAATTNYGPYRFALGGTKVGTIGMRRVEGGVTSIPQWYADLYLGGKRLLVGFGGYFSIATAGNVCLGPTGYAVSPPTNPLSFYTPPTGLDVEDNAFCPYESVQTLMEWGGATSPGTTVGRRSTDYEGRIPTLYLSSATIPTWSLLRTTAATTNVFSATNSPPSITVPCPNVFLNGLAGWIIVVTNAGVSQTKVILTNPINSTGTFTNVTLTVDSAWSTVPDNTYSFAIYKGGEYGYIANNTTGLSFTTNGYDTRREGPQGGSGTETNYFAGQTCRIVGGIGTGLSQQVSSYTYGSGIGTFTFPSSWASLPGGTALGGTISGNIANVAIGSPVVITTSAPHGIPLTGKFYVTIAGVDSYVNGPFAGFVYGITVINATKFSLDNSTGYFAYTNQGTWTCYLSTFIIDGPRFFGNIGSISGSTVNLDAFAPHASTFLGSGESTIKMLSGANAGEEHHISTYVYSGGQASLTIAEGIDPSLNNIGSSWSGGGPANGDQYELRPYINLAPTMFPLNGRGYCTWTDIYYGACCWVDTGTKHGLLYWPTRGVGQMYYYGSAVYCDSYKQTLQCFDPLSFLNGQDNWTGSTPDAAWEEDFHFPEFAYPITLFPDTVENINLVTGVPGPSDIGGIQFDSVTNRLYVMVNKAVQYGTTYGPRIHVFQIDAPALVISPTSLPSGTVSTPGYNQTITSTGGTGPYTFATTLGNLPNGLTLSSGGVLSGTPTLAGTYNFTITTTDSLGATGSWNYTVLINTGTAPPIPVRMQILIAGLCA